MSTVNCTSASKPGKSCKDLLQIVVICLTLLIVGCSDDPAPAPVEVAPPSEAETANDIHELPSDTPEQDTSNVTDATPPADAADDVPDIADEGPETPDVKPCKCGPTKHCIEGGGCIDDVCIKGATTCETLQSIKICNEDGSAFELEPCAEAQICYLGQCTDQLCDPDGPPFCEDGVRKVCNSLGLAYVEIPCPGGSGCLDGECTPIKPNVILVVDTSGSMSLLYDQDDKYPTDCAGDPDCPPWSFPDCDDPETPLTRLGRAKKALQALVMSDTAATVRLALQRFPQQGNKTVNCKKGYYSYKFAISGDVNAHELPKPTVANALDEIFSVPFSPATDINDTELLMSWMDFTEAVALTGESCSTNFACESNMCVGGQCQAHSDPELRGDGPTPLGKSLFYAGEYARHFVLMEGKACGGPTDCGSPHYVCVEGICRDPFFACRKTSIILFTDGIETVNEDPGTYFHPRVQAKRLKYGLECSADEECVGGAVCKDSRCWVEALDSVPEKMCNAVAQGCLESSDCEPFNCGLPTKCKGVCEKTAVTYEEFNGHSTLKGYEGQPLSITTHVIDASGSGDANTLIALNGGGQHVSVDFEDIGGLVAQLLTLLDTKDDAGACLDSGGETE